MSNWRVPNRSQLSKFLPDPESIKAFEELFKTVEAIAPDVVAEVIILAGSADARAVQAIGAVDRLAASLELLHGMPPVVPAVIPDNLSPPSVPAVIPDDLAPPFVVDLGAAAGTLPVASTRWNVRNLSSDVTAAAGDFCDVDASGANRSITLPDPAFNSGREVIVSKNDASANTVTMVGTVNGVASPTLTAQYETKNVVSNGTEWRVK